MMLKSKTVKGFAQNRSFSQTMMQPERSGGQDYDLFSRGALPGLNRTEKHSLYLIYMYCVAYLNTILTPCERQRSFVQRSLIILWGTLMISACAKPSSVGESSPIWIDQPYEEVSGKHYIAAVGEADDVNAASDRALANIAKVFEVKIDSYSNDFTQVNQLASNGKAVKNTRFEGVSQFVGASSKKILEGVFIQESWKSQTGRHYALAVLEKKLAEKLLLSNFEIAQTKASSFINIAEEGKNIVSIMSNLHQAKLSLAKVDIIKKQLLIIDASPLEIAHTMQSVQEQINKASSETKVHTNSTTPWLATLLSSAAMANGLQVTSRDGLELDADLVLDEIIEKQGWLWQKGVIKLALRQSNVILSEKIWNVKISSTEEGGVASRFQKEVSKHINSYVYQLLTQINVNK